MNTGKNRQIKNILVCGGTGKRGRLLCRNLLKNGNKVICIDDESSGWVVEIADCLDHPNFKFIQSKMEAVESFDLDEKIDLIYDYLPNSAGKLARAKIQSIAKEYNCQIIKKIDKPMSRDKER